MHKGIPKKLFGLDKILVKVRTKTVFLPTQHHFILFDLREKSLHGWSVEQHQYQERHGYHQD